MNSKKAEEILNELTIENDLFENEFEIEIDKEVDKNNKGFEEVVLSANSKAFREEFRYVKQEKKLKRESF